MHEVVLLQSLVTIRFDLKSTKFVNVIRVAFVINKCHKACETDFSAKQIKLYLAVRLLSLKLCLTVFTVFNQDDHILKQCQIYQTRPRELIL